MSAFLSACNNSAPMGRILLNYCIFVLKTCRENSSSIKEGKGKIHPTTGHESSEVEKRYSSTLSLTLSLPN
jgi:hypothetical protein